MAAIAPNSPPAPSTSVKWKASGPSSTKSKKFKPIITLQVNGLPAPISADRNPHTPGGGWSNLMMGVPGRNDMDKVYVASKQRWIPQWGAALEELRALKAVSPDVLGPAQRKMLHLQASQPYTIEEQVRMNRRVVSRNVRWNNDIPHPGDLRIWELIRLLASRKTADRKGIRDVFQNVIFDDTLWPESNTTTQSSGLRASVYPANTVDRNQMYQHLVNNCGITSSEVRHNIRPYLLRVTAASDATTEGASSSAPAATTPQPPASTSSSSS